MSISKAQAKALAAGFLDSLGEDKSVLQPAETFSELFLIAGELVDDAQKNLNASNSNASGKLSASIVLSNPREEGNTIVVDIVMNEYGEYVDKGVKGTKSGQGKYQFKTEFPSKQMLKNLQAGIGRAKRSTKNVNVKRSVSKNEIKNAQLAQLNRVWGAARNIKRYGIKPTGFMSKAISTAEKKVADRLGEALRVDIINSI
ncbi:MAG: hypothetical protein QM791_04135 [Ferruginibacter sp.]